MASNPHAATDDRSLADWMKATGGQVEAALERCLPSDAHPAPLLAQAMRYAVLGGGKRIRPLLVHAAGELGRAPTDVVAACACAVELIHTYSLIHDDLPCMDDDDLRRGRPTTHKVYGEAQALLAGDALQALAFEVLATALAGASARARRLPAGTMLAALAHAAGVDGMAGGQSIDLAAVGKPLARDALEQMHRLKTGAMLGVSVRLGLLAGGETDATAAAAIDRYSQRVGLAFQVVDDILDVVSDSATLGKTAGKDAASDKPTYVSLMGVDAARELATRLRGEAIDALGCFGDRGARLAGLADLIVTRVS